MSRVLAIRKDNNNKCTSKNVFSFCNCLHARPPALTLTSDTDLTLKVPLWTVEIFAEQPHLLPVDFVQHISKTRTFDFRKKVTSDFVLFSFLLESWLYLQTGRHRRAGLRVIRGFGHCCKDLLAYRCTGLSGVGRKVGLWVAEGYGGSRRTWLNCLLGEDREKMKAEDVGVWGRRWGAGDADWSLESGG